jgi:hypothetical protein
VSSRCWKLSPSDFAFLWDECPRCFYLKVVLGFPRPRAPMPEVLTRIDEQMKAGCEGRRTETLAAGMPAGVFELGERCVESQPLDVHLPDTVLRCLIRGKLDTVVRLDDGSYAVVDLQTGGRRAEHAPLYARQLQAFAYALEHPAPGAFALGPVTRLGLLVFEPEKFEREQAGLGALTGGLSWIEVPRDDGLLFGFLAELLAVLERPEPPGGAPLCDWCVYRDASRRTGL